MNRATIPYAAIVFLAVIVLSAWVGLHKIEQQTREASGEALQTVLLTTQKSLHLWASNCLKDAQAYATNPVVIRNAMQLLQTKRDSGSLLQSEALQQLRQQLNRDMELSGYLGFFIIAPDYTNLGSMRDTNIGSKNLIAAQRPDLLERVFHGESLIIPAIESDVPLAQHQLGLGAKQLPPTMFAATPLRDERNRVVAVFTIRLDPISDFSKLTSLGRIGKTGETYAFDKQAVLLSESRFQHELHERGLIGNGNSEILNIRLQVPQNNTVSLTHTDEQALTLMARHAIHGKAGLNVQGYLDYRGKPVFGAWLWDDELGFGLASEIDADEALQTYYSTRLILIITLGIAALLSLILVWILQRIRNKAMADLMKAHNVLENRVQERTENLLSINQHLQDQIIERTRAEEKLQQAQAELQKSNRQLQVLANKDDLTSLANRRAFENHLLEQWVLCRKKHSPLTLVIFDIDFFKHYNDIYGHMAGDNCLKTVAWQLQTGAYAKRPGDLICRYSGEEFAIILPNTEEKDAYKIAEKIRQDILDIAMPHHQKPENMAEVVSISTGIASIVPNTRDSAEILIQAADLALTRAQRNGRNRTESEFPQITPLTQPDQDQPNTLAR